MAKAEYSEPPKVEQFVVAFQSLSKMSERHLQMLLHHYEAPDRTLSAKDLATKLGYVNYAAVNAQYGRLARLVGEQVDYSPELERLGTLVQFVKRQNEWYWQMRPQVAEALEVLGWVDRAADLITEEKASATTPFVEGAVLTTSIDVHERNPEARQRCIEAHGANCCVCRFDFGAVYGEVADGFIHVHHLHPFSEVCGERIVDPVRDLRPVCPNCHAVIHLRTPAYSMEEMRSLLRSKSLD